MELTKEIQDLIAKGIPQIQADELKKFIEEANLNKKNLEVLTSKYQEVLKEKEQLSEKETLYKTASDTIKRAVELKEKTDAREREMNISLLKKEVEASDKIVDSYKEFILLLTKNPRAIEMISEFRNVPVYETPNQYGGRGFHTTKQEITTGTTEKTETKD